MLKKRHCDTNTKRTASTATKASRLKIVVVTAATVGVSLVTAHVFHMRSLPAPPEPPVPMQSDAEPLGQIDGGEPSLLGDAPLVGRLMTQAVQTESPPPFGIPTGHQPGEANAPDLSTPAVAVYEALALIDRGDTDQLTQCFAEGTKDTASRLYPQHLGHPIELVDVIEEGNAAKVIWKATVHTGFSLGGRSWSPGESMILTTRLVRVDGLWKLAKLYEGGEDGP